MSLAITNESKNSLSITNESKSKGLVWDDATMILNAATFAWDESGLGLMIFKESKNSLTITNESKN